jgi:PAS domain S-box-containing protein
MLGGGTAASTSVDSAEATALSDGTFERLMRSSPVAIVVSDASSGQILDVNDAYLRLLQYDRHEVLGKTSADLGVWSDPEARGALLADLAENSALRDYEAELRTRSGEIRQVLISIESVELDGTTYLLSQIYDVTERRRLEERLRIRDRRFRAIFDNTFQFTGLLAPDGTMLEANQTALDFAGVTAEDVINRPFWETRWWTRNRRTQERIREAVMEASHGKFVRFEIDVRGHGGIVAKIDFSLKPLRDESGQIIYLIPEGRDITGLRKAEAALLESELRFRSAFELSPTGMALVGLDGRWLEVNRALCEILGYSEGELRKLTFQDITHPDDLEVDLALTRQLFAGEIPSYQMEKRYIRKNGDVTWVLLIVSLISAADGTPLSALSQVVDITARKRAEQETARALELQQAANAELQRFSQWQRDFLSIFTHDFRTPLTVILGYSEVLQEQQDLADDAHEFAAIIHDNARRLNRMVDNLLDLDRLEAGQKPIRRQPVDLETVLREVAALFHASEATHPIALEIEPNLPYITGDRDELARALSNLIENAVKYSPDGGPITLVARQTGDDLHLEVRDQGIGIPESDLEVIFDRYARAERASTRRIRGTGLGLSIVRQIIDAHEGRVWAESGPGAGSTFHVTLPIPDVEDPLLPDADPARNLLR